MAVGVLTEAQKVTIHDLNVNHGLSKAQLARDYNVSERTIGRVVKEVQKFYDENHPEPTSDMMTTVSIDGTVSVSTVVDDEDEETNVDYNEMDDDDDQPWFSFRMNLWDSNTNGEITVIKTDSVETNGVSVLRANSVEIFDRAKDILIHCNGDDIHDQVLIAEAYAIIDVKSAIENFTHGKLSVDVERGVIQYVGDGAEPQNIPSGLNNRIITMVREGKAFDATGLLNFTNRLMENPSYRVVQNLYKFLEVTNIDIDADGFVVCYKKIRKDYTDVHTGTFDNSVGAKPRVNRNQVDEDPERTCSKGLHVCSKEYLASFGGERVVQCRVDPYDFVAIPKDYNFSKARVCGYEVVAELTGMI